MRRTKGKYLSTLQSGLFIVSLGGSLRNSIWGSNVYYQMRVLIRNVLFEPLGMNIAYGIRISLWDKKELTYEKE